MCLFTNDKNPRVATHDIPVFKVLCTDNSAPFFHGYVYRKGENRPEGDDNGFFSCMGSMIRGGWLHAFFIGQKPRVTRKVRQRTGQIGYIPYTVRTTAKMITDMTIDAVNARGYKAKVVKMYVPAGEQYYLGDDFDICAKCLVWPDDEAGKNVKE